MALLNPLQNQNFLFKTSPLKKPGFTLIELLIVVCLIALLSVIILTVFTQISKGRDSKRKSHLAQLKTVLEDYYSDHHCYPPQGPLMDCQTNPEFLRPYLSRIPCDPKGISYLYESDPGYGQPAANCPRWFRIYAKLENTSDPDSAKLGCSNGCGPDATYTFGVSSDNIQLGNTSSGGTSNPAACAGMGDMRWVCFVSGTNCQNVLVPPGSTTCTDHGGCFCTPNECQTRTPCT